MKIDQGIENLKYDLKDYNYDYCFLYHEGCDRLTVEKIDGSEYYIFDIFQHKDENGLLTIEWALPRSITKDGKTEVSPLDPEVWEYIEGDSKEGPMFGNTFTGAWATFDKDTGKVKLLSKGHTPKYDPFEVTRRISKANTEIKRIQERSKSNNNSKLDGPELKARDTLRDLISEKEWKRYVTNGYVLINGKSGKVYQVFANHKGRHIKVYEKGKNVHDLCIHSEGVPDTDHVLTCMMMIENDEKDFHNQCNKHTVYGNSNIDLFSGDGRDPRYRDKSLSQIFQTNKRIAEKLKIPTDWIDATEKREKAFKKAEAEITEKLAVRRGLRDIAAGRVVPAEEALEEFGIMLDALDNQEVVITANQKEELKETVERHHTRRRALREDRFNPEQEEEMNEVFYEILNDDVAIAN